MVSQIPDANAVGLWTFSLASGGGLMTLIGLGVGAYEILKQQGQQAQAGGMPPPAPPMAIR